LFFFHLIDHSLLSTNYFILIPEQMDFVNEIELLWDELPAHRREHWTKQGRDKDDFNSKFSHSRSDHSDIMAPGKDFRPTLVTVDIPKVKAFNFSFFETIDNIEIGLRESSPNKDDETFHSSMTLQDYVKTIQSGDHSLYAKIEDADNFKTSMAKEVGHVIIDEVAAALAESDLVGMGIFKPEWKDLDYETRDWALLMGGKGTTTAMHYDSDSFNFLYVVEGRKKVAMLQNVGLLDEDRFKIKTAYPGSAWADLNLLDETQQPEGTLVIELGPGSGVVIPHRAWHAVENLEHTVAFGFRINL
jgi:mannose-6-phosphate isomerase-like protein (cupin superfamily)